VSSGEPASPDRRIFHSAEAPFPLEDFRSTSHRGGVNGRGSHLDRVRAAAGIAEHQIPSDTLMQADECG
jgi:hypothetical protein